MAMDPRKKSKFDEQDAPENEGPKVGVEEGSDPERPTCPRCGWRNTRPSHTRGMLDWILRLAFRAFRCRSCGNRFQVLRRGRQG
jgi:transposase